MKELGKVGRKAIGSSVKISTLAEFRFNNPVLPDFDLKRATE